MSKSIFTHSLNLPSGSHIELRTQRDKVAESHNNSQRLPRLNRQHQAHEHEGGWEYNEQTYIGQEATAMREIENTKHLVYVTLNDTLANKIVEQTFILLLFNNITQVMFQLPKLQTKML